MKREPFVCVLNKDCTVFNLEELHGEKGAFRFKKKNWKMSEKSIAMKMAPLVSTNTGLCLESKWQKSLTATPHRTELLVLSITNAVHYVMLIVRSLSAKYRPDRYRRDKSVKFGTELP